MEKKKKQMKGKVGRADRRKEDKEKKQETRSEKEKDEKGRRRKKEKKGENWTKKLNQKEKGREKFSKINYLVEQIDQLHFLFKKQKKVGQKKRNHFKRRSEKEASLYRFRWEMRGEQISFRAETKATNVVKSFLVRVLLSILKADSIRSRFGIC